MQSLLHLPPTTNIKTHRQIHLTTEIFYASFLLRIQAKSLNIVWRLVQCILNRPTECSIGGLSSGIVVLTIKEDCYHCLRNSFAFGYNDIGDLQLRSLNNAQTTVSWWVCFRKRSWFYFVFICLSASPGFVIIIIELMISIIASGGHECFFIFSCFYLQLDTTVYSDQLQKDLLFYVLYVILKDLQR